MTQHHDQATPTTSLPPTRRGRHDRKLVRTAAAITTTVLLLTGCTTPPVTPPSSTATPSSTTTAGTTTPPPTPTPEAPIYKPATDQGPAENVPFPVLPEQAREFSKEGLIAFTEHWYSTLGYAFETGDPQPMMDISDPACQPCGLVQQSALGGHSDGRWIVGGQMHVLGSETSFVPVADGTYQVIATVRQDNVKYYRADKTLSKDLGITTAIADILVASYNGSHWTANTVEHLQGSKGL